MKTYRIGPATVTLTEDGPWHVATAQIPTKEGDITITARGSEALMRSAYPVKVSGGRAYVGGYSMPARLLNDEVGGFFGDIGKAWKKITKSKVFRSVLAQIPAITSNPAFSSLAAMIPGVGPALAAAGPVAGPAAGMLLAATQGNPKAQKRVTQIMKLAKKGDRGAVQALGAMQAMRAVAKKAYAAGPQASRAFDAAVRHAANPVSRAPITPEVEPDEIIETEYDEEIGGYRVRPNANPVFGYAAPRSPRRAGRAR